jgi:AbrB family looped-hinge helix DNA binding protein
MLASGFTGECCSPILYAMPSTISEKGQVTIPKELRDQLGLAAGTRVIFSAENGRLVAVKEAKANPFSRWAGKGKLPAGMNTDDYLRLTRDGHGD